MDLNTEKKNFEQYLKWVVGILMAVIVFLYVDNKSNEKDLQLEIKILNQNHLKYIIETDEQLNNLNYRLDTIIKQKNKE